MVILWHACWPHICHQPCALRLYHTVSTLSFAFHHVLSLPKPVALSGWRAEAISCSEPVQDWTSLCLHAGLLPAEAGRKILPLLPLPVTCVSRDVLAHQVAWPLALEPGYPGTGSLYLALLMEQ